MRQAQPRLTNTQIMGARRRHLSAAERRRRAKLRDALTRQPCSNCGGELSRYAASYVATGRGLEEFDPDAETQYQCHFCGAKLRREGGAWATAERVVKLGAKAAAKGRNAAGARP